MVQKEEIQPFEIDGFFADACQEQSPVIASMMNEGRWRLIELTVSSVSPKEIVFSSTDTTCELLKTEQPVGICVHLGYFKYLFDTMVISIQKQGLFWRILLDKPEHVERIQRRMYHRQPVPASMKVKVQFWHRGYLNDKTDDDPGELYWQGQLRNLSAGGAQFEIEAEDKEHFKVGQLLGIQFTPLSYQKPLLLESHVRYLREQSNGAFKIGVEFLGLEASPEGRKVLSRILAVIGEYEEMNEQNHPAHT